MKNLLSVLALIGFGTLEAQISYTFNDGPRVGLALKKALLDYDQMRHIPGLLDTGMVNIDISHINPIQGTESEYRMKNPNEVPGGNLFPGANIAVQDYPDEKFSRFYKKTPTNLILLGEYIDGSSSRHKNGLVINPYPLKFRDSYMQYDSVIVVQDFFEMEVDLKWNSQVNSWGTITTQAGSFPYIKIFSKGILEGSNAGNQVFNATIELHSWYTSGKAEPVAEINIIEQEIFDLIEMDTTVEILLEQSPFVSTEEGIERPKSTFELKYFPNEETVQLSMMPNHYRRAEVVVVDASNRVRCSQECSPQEPTLRIHTRGWPQGPYLVQVVFDNQHMEFEQFLKL